jgi:hypothetical protein
VFVEGSFQNGLLAYPPTLIMYFAAFIPGSILMSWIYYRTNRSTLSAILFHFAGNAAGEMFHLALPTRVIQTALAVGFAAVVLWAEWPLFTQREFWVDFPGSGKGLPRKRRGVSCPATGRPAAAGHVTAPEPRRSEEVISHTLRSFGWGLK